MPQSLNANQGGHFKKQRPPVLYLSEDPDETGAKDQTVVIENAGPGGSEGNSKVPENEKSGK